MRGDFSAWNEEKKLNFRGTLHQQGRVLLDRDWNAQTEIFNDWQETAARDTIGAGVAAVPADAADGFKVTKAEIVGSEVLVSINRGRVWADGLLVELNEKNAPDLEFIAEYLAPPIQNPKQSPPNPQNSSVVRDAVILETWLEELNAFQKPSLLIEPALGGVDTTERMHAAFRFRLFRMQAGDTCDSIKNALADDFSTKGKLRATLQPNIVVGGDCPTVEGGGYTGFEHQLYRIEIAETERAGAWFKWSQFNGGLVGRAIFNNNEIDIKANRNQIINSGLTDFYLEAVEFNTKYNFWRVIYGAKVTLDSDNLLVPSDVHFGDFPASATNQTFFRLWNNIETIADYVADKELQDGIHLQFEPEDVGKYTAHDYWTFPVRAGEIENSEVLFESKPPEGIFYHRVPLAEINWNDDESIEAGTQIEDCRQIFQPLTKLKGCCTYRVGDGISSHGDFTSIKQAINALPAAGGEICVLPGTFRENIVLETNHNRNITIKGCGSRSRLIADQPEPAIHVRGGENLQIKTLAIEAHVESVGILLEGDEIVAGRGEETEEKFGTLREVQLEHLEINAAKYSAIELHVGQFVSITDCRILIADEDTERAAVYLAGDDLLVERNEIRVLSARQKQTENAETENVVVVVAENSETEKNSFKKTDDAATYRPARRATGGLHLSGGCERVRVINNLIIGGTGNGINLGSVDRIVDGETVVTHDPWHTGNNHDEGECDPNPGYIDGTEIDENSQYVAGAPLRDVLIERNRIYAMGRNGIGVDAFFVIETKSNNNQLSQYERQRIEFIKVENFVVIGNRIEFCLNRPPVDIPERMTALMGYGGIALSEVETLVVRDNFICDNGANFLNATCGIFILYGKDIEIARNRVTNNGWRNSEKPNEKTVKNGARGGIFILFALNAAPRGAGRDVLPTSGEEKLQMSMAMSSSVPALRMRENVVAAPLGRALTVNALGDVYVTDNHFSSQGILPGFTLDSLAALIMILNFGKMTSLQNEPVSYAGAADGTKTKMPIQEGMPLNSNLGTNEEKDDAAARLPFKALSGAIHFAGNRCELSNPDRKPRFAFTSILIAGLDDVSFLHNQTQCLVGIILIDTFVFGLTVRASDNNWQDYPNTVWLSALTFGFLNTTTDNHSTHCVTVIGILYVDRHNLSAADLVKGYTGNAALNKESSPCEKLSEKWNKMLVAAMQPPDGQNPPPAPPIE